MERKKCLRCGHVRQEYETGRPEQCPNCGAFYAKVEAQLKNGAQRKPPKQRPVKSSGSSVIKKAAAALIAAKDAPRQAEAEARKHQNVLVRTYKGKQSEAIIAFQNDAAVLEHEGFEPSHQMWEDGKYGCAPFLLALFLSLLIIGIPLLFYLIIVKPAGTLTVTYKRVRKPNDERYSGT